MHPLLRTGNDEIESQLKRDRMMAKNEIKMLLLGAGESGKVRWFRFSFSTHYLYLTGASTPPIVDRPEADEAHSSRWLQRRRKGFLQGNHLLQHDTVHAVSTG